MANTAFVSEYYDKRTQGPGSRADQATAPTFGAQETPPPMYHQEPKSGKAGRGSVIVSVVLRTLTLLFAVVALAVLATSTGKFGVQENETTVSIKTVRFTVLRAFTYLFSACVAVAVYSLVMMLVSLVGLWVSTLANSKILLAIIFFCDQVLAYVLISAGAAGANGVMVSNKDENLTGGTQVGLTCEGLGLTGFCNKASASVALAFIAFLFLAITSVLSARRLFSR